MNQEENKNFNGYSGRTFAAIEVDLTPDQIHDYRVARFEKIKAQHKHLFNNDYKIDKPIDDPHLKTEVMVIRNDKLKKIYIGI